MSALNHLHDNVITNYDFEIKKSKTDLPIPQINDVYLHSSYDPIKEAQSFVEKNSELISNNKNFLVLGHGYGYHLKALSDYCKILHGESFKIFVVEPNANLVTHYNENQEAILNVHVFSSQQIKKYYLNEHFLNFLISKPSVIAHPASFNLYNNFFKSFLNFDSNQIYTESLNLIEKKSLLEVLKVKKSIWEAIEDSKEKKEIEKTDALLLMLNEFKKKYTASSGAQDEKCTSN